MSFIRLKDTWIRVSEIESVSKHQVESTNAFQMVITTRSGQTILRPVSSLEADEFFGLFRRAVDED